MLLWASPVQNRGYWELRCEKGGRWRAPLGRLGATFGAQIGTPGQAKPRQIDGRCDENRDLKGLGKHCGQRRLKKSKDGCGKGGRKTQSLKSEPLSCEIVVSGVSGAQRGVDDVPPWPVSGRFWDPNGGPLPRKTATNRREV